MDSLLLTERDIAGQASLLACVCDGVGSMEDGAFAAFRATQMMNDWFCGLTDTERVGLRMRDAVLHLNETIIGEAKADSLNTASTLTALLLVGSGYYGVHIGDSRAYSFAADGTPTLLTTDDVSENGRLTGCIGKFENPILLCVEGDASERTFLICSDGLYKRTDMASVFAEGNLKHAKGIKKLVNRLAGNAIESGERDNISLAIIIPIQRGIL